MVGTHTTRLEGTGMRIQVPNTVRIDFSRWEAAKPGELPFHLLHETKAPGNSFTFVYRTPGKTAQYTFGKGALEGELCLQTGHLRGFLDKVGRYGFTHPWFTPLLVGISDESVRDRLADPRTLLPAYSTHPRTVALVQQLGGLYALQRNLPNSNLYDRMQQLQDDNTLVLPVADRKGRVVVQTRPLPEVGTPSS